MVLLLLLLTVQPGLWFLLSLRFIRVRRTHFPGFGLLAPHYLPRVLYWGPL
jgi:hypothetical protein